MQNEKFDNYEPQDRLVKGLVTPLISDQMSLNQSSQLKQNKTKDEKKEMLLGKSSYKLVWQTMVNY